MLYALETFAEFTDNATDLKQFSGKFQAYFSAYMQDADAEISIEAASSFINFISFLESEDELAAYKDILQPMIGKLIEAVKFDQDKGLKMVNSIDCLIKSHPRFVKDQANRFLEIFTEMATSKNLTSGLRNAALLTIYSLAVKLPQAVKKSSFFLTKTIPNVMLIITEQPDDLAEWLKSTDTHELSSQSVESNAIETFSRLNESLGSKFMLENTFKFSKEALGSPNWKDKYAGLMSLAMLFEGCKEHFKSDDDLKGLLTILIPTLSNPHPKVLYASMTCIALLTTEFSPDLQINYFKQILDPVYTVLKNASEKKLKLRAVSMLINFFRELLECDEDETKFMDNCTDGIMEELLKLFESGLQAGDIDSIDEVVSLISIFAALRGDKFANFYGRLMPPLKKLLFEIPNNTESNNKLRTLIISTIGYVLACYRERPQEIEGDIMDVMRELVKLQKTLQPDDSQHKSILEVYEVLVGALKEKFLPFMKEVVEQTMQCATRNIEFHVEDCLDSDAKVEDHKNKADKQVLIDLKILGGKKLVSMNHSNLEQKVVAFDMIRQMAKVLKKNLRPWLEPLADLVYQHLTYKFSSGIREFCYKSLKHLMGVCSTEEECLKLFEKFAPVLLQMASDFLGAENDEKSHSILKHLKAAGEVFKTAQISEGLINEWFKVLKRALEVCAKRKQEIVKEYGPTDKLSEEDREDFEADFAEPNMLMHVVMDTSSLIMKLYKSKYEEKVANELGYYFFKVSQKPEVEDEIHYACCFYAELLNNCSEELLSKGYQTVFDLIFNSLAKTTDVNYQQTGSFLLGVRVVRLNIRYWPRDAVRNSSREIWRNLWLSSQAT